MDPLPMYTPPPAPDAWHQTLAPGGYESWHVTFSDPGSQTHLVVSLMTGCQYHPGYLVGFERYLDNPTRVAPPLPPDWPSAHLTLFREGKLYAESLVQFPREALVALRSSLDFSVGPNRLVRTPDSFRLTFRGRPVTHSRIGPRHPQGLVQLDLTLYTISQAVAPRRVFAEASGDAHHLWAPVAAPCNAKGEVTIRLGGDAAAKGETIPLAGRAAIDHDLGTRPLAQGFSAWLGGTAFLSRDVIPFRIVSAKGRPTEPLVALFGADGQFHPFSPTDARTTWTKSKRPHPTYLEALPYLRLDSPQLLPSPGPVLHLLYRATTPSSETGHAFCRVLHPDRVDKRYARLFHAPELAAAPA